VYQCPSASCGTLSGNTYTGSWTRFDIIWRWSCVDDEDWSGCKTTDPIISPNLHHFQSSHIPDLSYLTDKTDNNPDNDGKDDTTKSCDSYVRKPTDIQRSCYYVIDQAKVQEVMSSGSLATSLTNLQTYSGALYTTLSNIKDGTIPSPWDSNFGRAISNLREASRFLFCPGGKDFNITWAIWDNSCLHKLYYINESTCKYTPIYWAATFPILIDKILPTINISTTVDSTTKTVLNQEDDSSETPHFTAGTGVVVVTMEDRSRSEYLPNEAYSHQLSFSGISGIRSYYIEVKRTKNFKWELLDADGNISPSGTGYILYLTGNTLDDEYNPDGTVWLNHVIIFSGWVHENVFRMAGTYDIKVIVRDWAGNRNPTTATFVVDPTDPPVFSCITDPCSCLSRPPICTPSLCDAKNWPFPGCCVIYPSNPQCRSIKIETTPGTSSLTKLREKSASPYYASWSEIDSADIIYTISGTTSGSVPITGLTPIPFANAFDRSLYRIHIADTDGNPVYNWPIIGLTLSTTGIYLDEVNRTGTTALWIDAGQGYKNTPQTIQTDENGNIFFRILSYTPGQYTEQLSFSYFNPWINSSNNYAREATGSLQTVTGFPRIDLAQTWQFYHILTGAIDLYTNDRIDLGTENDIRLEFFTTTTTTDTTLTGFTVSNFLDSLKSLNETNFEVTNTGSTYSTGINLNSLGYPTPNNPSGATGTFIPEQVWGLFGDILEIRTWPYLTLTFGDSSRGGPQTAIYWASTAIGNYLSGITYAGGWVNRIYIEGTKRATGKEGYVDATASIGSTNSADVRNAVHKNVAILLRNRAPSSDTTKIVNRVKYVTGDQTGSTVFADFWSWDTLVIKDGNLTIDANFNSGPNLNSISHKGIIVLSEDGTKGNIYIKPNVQFIGATLFADESIYSVNDMGAVYTNSDSARTSDLNKQLVFYGGIFSKNTVGGAVRADNDGEYTLPWKGKTRNLDEAVKYDLAFLRMDKIDVLSSLNRWHNEYFVVILHDARNLSKPLPGFATTVR
jgi:hypothetical protein